jgi:phage gp16-like protein
MVSRRAGDKAAQLRRLKTLIHVARSQLGWTDDIYRDVLRRLAGQASAADCNAAQLQTVLDYMKTQGFKPSSKHGRRPHVPSSREDLLKKIEALLADSDRPWGYAEAMARQMFKRQAIEWLTDNELYKLMQALAVDADRRKRRGEQDEAGKS